MRNITTSKGVITIGKKSVPMKKMDCRSDMDTLPKLPGCPADDEYFLVVNAKYGSGENGYALRAWGDIKVCVGDNPDPEPEPEPEPGVDTNTNIANADLVFDAGHKTNLSGFKWAIHNGEEITLVIGALPAVVTEPSDFLVIDTATKEIKRRANPGWDILGNTGTDPTINFIGTTDAKDVVFRTNSTERFKIKDVPYSRIDTSGFEGFYVNSGYGTNDKTNTCSIAISGHANQPALSNIKKKEGFSYSQSNVAIGTYAGHTLEDGYWNVMIGFWTGGSLNPSADQNVLVGPGHFMGWGPGSVHPYPCSQNFCFGAFNLQFGGYEGPALGNMSIGSQNFIHVHGEIRDTIAIGGNVGREHGQCIENIYIGTTIAWWAGAASRNVVIGHVDGVDENGNYAAIYSNDSDNVAIGYRVLGWRGGGNKNVVIGAYAGYTHSLAGRMRGTANIHIGYNSGATSNTSINAVIIGSGVGPLDSNGNGQININNIIYGINGYTDIVTVSNVPTATGSIGIGVQTPGGRLHIGASSSNRPSLRFDVGVDPNTVNAGDVWFDGTNIRMKQVSLSAITLNTITNASSMTALNLVSANGLLLPLFDNAAQAAMSPVKYAMHVNTTANRPIYYDGTNFKTVAFTDDTFTVTSVPEDNADGGDANTVYGGGLFIDGGTA